MLWSFVYLVVRNLFALVWLLGRRRRSKELEILVLGHELAVLRRQTSRPRLTRADRALLASLSRLLARPAWAVFPIKPETLLRWHRQLIARVGCMNTISLQIEDFARAESVHPARAADGGGHSPPDQDVSHWPHGWRWRTRSGPFQSA